MDLRASITKLVDRIGKRFTLSPIHRRRISCLTAGAQNSQPTKTHHVYKLVAKPRS